MSSMTMSGTHGLDTYPKIRQPLALLYPPMHPFLPRNHPILILIEDPLRNLYNIAFPALINILCRLVVKSICTSDLLRGPDAVVVEVMEGEEGGRIKVRDMVFFWKRMSIGIRRFYAKGRLYVRTSHVTRCPVCVVGDGDLMAVGEDVGRESEGGEDGRGEHGGWKSKLYAKWA